MATRLARRGLMGVAAVVIALVVLHIYNHLRLDAGELVDRVEPILSQAHAMSEKAKPEYQELALATLPRNAMTGPYYRLDEMLDRAVPTPPPDKAVAGAEVSVVHGFEFDDPRSEHTSELQSQSNLVCRLLLEKKKNKK